MIVQVLKLLKFQNIHAIASSISFNKGITEELDSLVLGALKAVEWSNKFADSYHDWIVLSESA